MAFNLTLRTTKGSRLTHTELDNNFLYLKDRDIVDAGIIGPDLVLTKQDGDTFNIPLSAITASDTYVSGMTFNNSTYDLTLGLNNGVNLTQNLTALASDIFLMSGEYNPSNGTIEFTYNSGNTFSVSGFTTGMTNYYTTQATLNDKTLSFDRTDTLSAYTVDLTSISKEKYVTTSGFTADVTETINHNLGIGDECTVTLIDTINNTKIGGVVDNYTTNTLDITLSETLSSVKITILG